MRLPACIVASLLLLASGITRSAESIARVRVAFDRDGITSTRTEGYADPATKRAITVDDPVRIASISKLVLTIGVMWRVEEGKLDLDADVSKALGWTLRNPAFPNDRITLRLLLSHTSSLTDGAGYWQVPLDGEFKELLDDPKAWDAAHAPGTYWRYANVGFLSKIGRLLLGDGIVDGVRLLKPESVRAMIGPEWTLKDGNGLTFEEDDPIRATKGFTCRYGLAVHTLSSGAPDCGDPFGDGVQRVGHSGNAYGLLCGFVGGSKGRDRRG